MEVVSMLNAMYSIFDRLTELNGVYKVSAIQILVYPFGCKNTISFHQVETIGDAYMAVGGAPVKDVLHAARICDMALDMVDAIQDLTDPSTGLNFLLHSITRLCSSAVVCIFPPS